MRINETLCSLCSLIPLFACGAEPSAKVDTSSAVVSAEFRPVGTTYLWDDFSDPGTSSRIWMLDGRASCLTESHSTPRSRGGVRYPRLGGASRPGSCRIESNPSDGDFLRFVTQPFDRRDAGNPFRGTRIVPYVDSVDLGKGGSETRADPAYLFGSTEGGKPAEKGWDVHGSAYWANHNRIRLSVDFRLADLSMLEQDLASSTTLLQLHAVNSINSGLSCGRYFKGMSPSPGLYLKVDGEMVEFSLGIKVFRGGLPASLLQHFSTAELDSRCSPETSTDGQAVQEICKLTVWTHRMAKSDALGQWMSVSLFITPASPNQPPPTRGMLELYFGLKNGDPTTNPDARQSRRFVDSTWKLGIPTQATDCPNRVYLGNYVLGYKEYLAGVGTASNGRAPLHGFIASKWLGLANGSRAQMRTACATHGFAETPYWYPAGHRFCQSLPERTPLPGGDWVAPEFDARYGRFIVGAQLADETPPQLIVDYDKFRIVEASNEE